MFGFELSSPKALFTNATILSNNRAYKALSQPTMASVLGLLAAIRYAHTSDASRYKSFRQVVGRHT